MFQAQATKLRERHPAIHISLPIPLFITLIRTSQYLFGFLGSRVEMEGEAHVHFWDMIASRPKIYHAEYNATRNKYAMWIHYYS